MLQNFSWVKEPFRMWHRQVDFNVTKNEKLPFHMAANLWETLICQVLAMWHGSCLLDLVMLYCENSALSAHCTTRKPWFQGHYDAIWHSFENT